MDDEKETQAEPAKEPVDPYRYKPKGVTRKAYRRIKATNKAKDRSVDAPLIKSDKAEKKARKMAVKSQKANRAHANKKRRKVRAKHK